MQQRQPAPCASPCAPWTDGGAFTFFPTTARRLRRPDPGRRLRRLRDQLVPSTTNTPNVTTEAATSSAHDFDHILGLGPRARTRGFDLRRRRRRPLRPTPYDQGSVMHYPVVRRRDPARTCRSPTRTPRAWPRCTARPVAKPRLNRLSGLHVVRLGFLDRGRLGLGKRAVPPACRARRKRRRQRVPGLHVVRLGPRRGRAWGWENEQSRRVPEKLLHAWNDGPRRRVRPHARRGPAARAVPALAGAMRARAGPRPSEARRWRRGRQGRRGGRRWGDGGRFGLDQGLALVP